MHQYIKTYRAVSTNPSCRRTHVPIVSVPCSNRPTRAYASDICMRVGVGLRGMSIKASSCSRVRGLKMNGPAGLWVAKHTKQSVHLHMHMHSTVPTPATSTRMLPRVGHGRSRGQALHCTSNQTCIKSGAREGPHLCVWRCHPQARLMRLQHCSRESNGKRERDEPTCRCLTWTLPVSTHSGE